MASGKPNLEDAEGWVLKLLLRDFGDLNFSSLLIEKFPMLEGLENEGIQVLHGNLTKNCEIDGLLFLHECRIIFLSRNHKVFKIRTNHFCVTSTI